MLVREVSVYYQRRIVSIGSTEVSIDFNTIFGRYMEEFYRRKNHVTDLMWEYSLGGSVSTDIRVIRKWLGPRDRTLQTILDDRLAARAQRDEYTCEWFQRHLLDFSRSKDKTILSVVGPAGCGKTVLSGWIIERLQRSLGKKSHETLAFTFGALPPK